MHGKENACQHLNLQANATEAPQCPERVQETRRWIVKDMAMTSLKNGLFQQTKSEAENRQENETKATGSPKSRERRANRAFPFPLDS